MREKPRRNAAAPRRTRYPDEARARPLLARAAAPATEVGSTASPVLFLQRTLGNAHVQRLLQRYPVPADLPCDHVVGWLNANSPYAPEWAQTHSTFTFVGDAKFKITPEPDGTFTAQIKGHGGLKVAVKSPVDRPTWAPSKRPGLAAEAKAWGAMRAQLDKHENDHKKIAESERARVEGEFQALDITVHGATEAEARGAAVAALQAKQQAWQAASQKAQDAIDPFRGANLACPAAAPADGDTP
jgi:hypothetical protein